VADCIDDTVFIVADFGTNETRDAINKKLELIIKSCTEINLEAQSAQNFKGGGNIVSKIKKAIEDAEFIICDISEPRGYPNPNVYYEFGYAHGCENDENDLFTICDQDTFSRLSLENKLPFDIRIEQIHVFGSDEELVTIIKENLIYMKNKREK